MKVSNAVMANCNADARLKIAREANGLRLRLIPSAAYGCLADAKAIVL